ncbi:MULTISPECIES: DNA polymerase III subunit gamma/tau [unclassified Treponema]|uniref:DNA polymerase III subunit gamma/tau n=1 Tax=unclassified Treponema TaxID=2638727 RepID=UPI0025F5ED19|nr:MULTISPECIES: DNA polymerase III subunit gamma/tau [unclassified Treponema]
MSYEVTATRRRPQRFEDLVGQEFVAETFRNAIQSKKIAHAYLFSGPRGCGKTSTARILAKALNCAEGPTASPCGHCQQCLEITKGTCTDVIEIDGASNTSVNDVRQIKDEVLFPPQSCRYKIYIIDEVHMLSTSAFNALLKTIEEPPPYVIFIFATTELQKVPATIKSRCQQFNFRLVPVEKVKEQLALAASEIGIQAEDEALYWIARESTGSMRDAYTLFDQVAAFSGDKITYDKIRDKLGLVGVDRLNEIFEDCAENKTQSALEKLDSFLQAGISIEQLISNATDYLRSLLLIKNGITKESLLGQSAERFSAKVLSAWNSIQIERAVSIFLQLYRDIRYSLSPRYELELAFSRLSWLSQYVSPAEVKIAIDKTKAVLLQNAQPSSQAQNSSLEMTQASQQQPQMQSQSQKPRIFISPEPKVAPQTENRSFSNGGAEPPDQAAAQSIENFSDFENYAPEGSYAPDDLGLSQQENSVPKQNSQPAGFVRDMQALKKTILSELSKSEKTAILATTLIQTAEWVLDGNTVKTTVASNFTQSQLQKQAAQISAIISQYYGENLQFSVSIKQAAKENSLENAPYEVQLLCSIFRGQIVSKGERTESPKPEKNEKTDDESDENIENSNFNNEIIEEEDESI